MLHLDIKKLLLNEIPSSITIDNHAFLINKTLGSIPLNQMALPTINIKFIGEGTLHSRSFDDEADYSDNITTYYQNIYSCVIRYTVCANDSLITTSDTIKYVTGTNSYTLARVPVVQLNSITGYVKDTDYRLSNDRTSIEWIGSKPANNVNFTVNYDWINSGYYISHQLTHYLMQDVKGRVFKLLQPYNIDFIDVKGIVDLSDIYVDSVLNILSFDINITYPFLWSTTISEEDSVIADTIALDLLVNNKDVGTITYTKN